MHGKSKLNKKIEKRYFFSDLWFFHSVVKVSLKIYVFRVVLLSEIRKLEFKNHSWVDRDYILLQIARIQLKPSLAMLSIYILQHKHLQLRWKQIINSVYVYLGVSKLNSETV